MPAVYRRAFGRNNGIWQQLALGHGAQGRHAANELDEGILHGILGLAVVTQNIIGLAIHGLVALLVKIYHKCAVGVVLYRH